MKCEAATFRHCMWFLRRHVLLSFFNHDRAHGVAERESAGLFTHIEWFRLAFEYQFGVSQCQHNGHTRCAPVCQYRNVKTAQLNFTFAMVSTEWRRHKRKRLQEKPSNKMPNKNWWHSVSILSIFSATICVRVTANGCNPTDPNNGSHFNLKYCTQDVGRWQLSPASVHVTRND